MLAGGDDDGAAGGDETSDGEPDPAPNVGSCQVAAAPLPHSGTAATGAWLAVWRGRSADVLSQARGVLGGQWLAGCGRG